MAITVRELVTKWGFKVNTKPLDQMNDQIERSKKLARQTAIAIGGISAAVGVLLFQAGKMEQWRIAFETMLGSADKANKLLNDIKQFTLETPFQLPEVVEGAKRLLAFGIEADKLIPTLKFLGDVSAGLGADLGRMILNFGQVRTQAKLTGRELKDFSVLGVPLRDALSKILDVPVSEVAGLGVSFEIVEQAFISMTSEGGKFFNLMRRQMAALFGIISNIRDMFTQISINLGNKLLPEARRITKQFLVFLIINQKLIELEIGKLLKNLIKFVQRLLKIMNSVIRRLIGILKLVGGLNNAIRLLLISFTAFLGLNVVLLLGSMAVALGVLIKGMRILGNEALIAQAKMLLIPLAIGTALVGIGLFIDDLIAFLRGDDSIIGLLIDLIENRLPKAIRALINPFSPLIDLFNNAAKIGNLASAGAGFLSSPIAPVLSGIGKIANQVSINSPININVPEGTDLNNVGKEVRVGIIETVGNILRTTFDSIEDGGK